MEVEIFAKVAEETKAYAGLCRGVRGTDDKLWCATDAAEIKTFVELLIMMGVNPMHEYTDYWSGDQFLENVGFKRVMSLSRCEKLSQYLHCNCAAARLERTVDRYHLMEKVRPLVSITH